MLRSRKPQTEKTSWEPIEKWYSASVGKDGHYYHKQLVIPGILKLMKFKPGPGQAFIDLACGQGVLARHLPQEMPYTGIDIAPSLIKEARRLDPEPHRQYIVGDVSKALAVKDGSFSHAAVVLALQNIEQADRVIHNAAKALKQHGQFVIVLNHPCFRIPRQTSWQVDAEKKIQFRRIDRYASEMRIPIQAHPSQQEKSPTTWTFHHPLSTYTKWLFESGFLIEQMEEWCSDKVSVGGAAKMENRSREEFPLFLTISARKK